LLHEQFDTSEPSDDERALGYAGPASFFGPHASYDRSTGLSDALLFGLPPASLTPLATRRVLERIRVHIEAATRAASQGVRDDLTSDNCRFLKIVNKHYARQHDAAQG
jgi:hypothetical protein